MPGIECPLQTLPIEGEERLVRVVPQSCQNCIATARTSPLALRESKRTIDEAGARLEAGDATNIEPWSDVGIARTENGFGRKAVKRAGIQVTIGNGSAGIRTEHTSTHFDCTLAVERTIPTELKDEFGNDYWESTICPDQLTLPTGRYDPLVESKFYRPLQEDRYEIMLAAVRITASSLKKDNKGYVIAENRLNENMVMRLLAIVSDMPIDVPIEHRLLVWQAVFEADELLVAEHAGQTANAIHHAHRNDPAIAERLEGVYNAAVNLKLEHLGDTLGTQAITVEELDLRNLRPQSAVDDITKYFPEALTALEALAVLELSVRPTIEQKLEDDNAKNARMIH